VRVYKSRTTHNTELTSRGAALPTDNSKTEAARALIFTGTLMFLAGFVFWNLDNVFCAQVRARLLLHAANARDANGSCA